MTSLLQYLNFKGAGWWFSSRLPHPIVLGKYLCLQNVVGWQPRKRMSFISLQEIWFQALFYLNSFSLFHQLFKSPSLLRRSDPCLRFRRRQRQGGVCPSWGRTLLPPYLAIQTGVILKAKWNVGYRD